MEFTGTYYKCNNCGHFWDYNEFNCPFCGSVAFSDKSIVEEIEEQEQELERLRNMKDLHQ